MIKGKENRDMGSRMRKGTALMTAVLMIIGMIGVGGASAGNDERTGAPEEEISVRVRGEIRRVGDYLYRVLEDDTCEIVEYAGEDEIREVPGEIAGHKVTALGEGCFSNAGDMNYYTDEYPDYHREYIRSVRLPEGIVRIGDYAFEDCFNLVEMILPESLRQIGEGAFSGCTSLMKIELPDGLEKLGDYTFRGCAALTGLRLPDSLQTLGANPFADCTHLSRLELSLFHPFLRYEKGMLYDMVQKKLVACTREAWGKQAEIPEGIREIGESAFSSAPFERIGLPESLETIGSYAFSGCTEMRELTIPERVGTIGDNPARGCLALESIRIQGKGSAFSVRDDALIDADGGRLIAFLRLLSPEPEEPYRYRDDLPSETEYAGTILRRVHPHYTSGTETEEAGEIYTVPDGIREIGAYAFYRARVGTVTLPEEVRSVGAGAFEECSLLKECRLPSQIRAIPDRLFFGCAALQASPLPEGTVSIGEYAFSRSGITAIRLPSSVQSIGRYAFAYCEQLLEVELSDGLRKIPKGAFLHSGAETIRIPEGVTEIEAEAFARCFNLTYVNLPSGITSIPEFCFFDSVIREITIPDSVTYIGDHAFRTDEYNQSNLETLSLPEGIEYIGHCAFMGGIFTEISLPGGIAVMGKRVFDRCYELKKVRLAEGLKMISEGMFSSSDLQEVEIPDSVSFIGDGAFSGASLTAVKLPGGRTEITGNPFPGCGIESLDVGKGHPNLKTEGPLLIDVPAKRVIACLSNPTGEKITVPEGIETIGRNAFAGVNLASGIVLPESLRRIEDGAFQGIELKEIRLPEKLEEIGNGAFENTEIHEIRLPGRLKAIGAEAFRGTRITSVVVPASVEWIGLRAFDTIRLERIDFAGNPVVLQGRPFSLGWGENAPEIILPEDHPTLEMSDGNLYSREDHRLLALLTDAPIREDTVIIEEKALEGKESPVIPGSVTLIRYYGEEWFYQEMTPYVVPGSAAEAFFDR